jgi:hypothetical protein
MNKPNLSKLGKDIKVFATKHSPELLIGLGVTGMFTTIVLAVSATPKALRKIEEKKKEEKKESLTPVETVQATWKCYIPAAVTATVSTACIVGGTTNGLKRNTALAAAYKLTETAFAEYKEKVVETVGEKKEQAVRDAVAKEKIDKRPVTSNEVIITEKGNTLCFDSITGRYYKSDIEKIKSVVNELNRRMRNYNYISLNDFYDEIGLDRVDIGDDLGWNIDRGYIDPDFSSHLAADGTPCVVVSFNLMPIYGYSDFV